MLLKLENPLRVSELSPKETLIRVGCDKDTVLCDIGAGTGLFSFAATEISNKTVYALEISDDMIGILENRKAERCVKNLEIRKVFSDSLPLEADLCNMALLVTVLHEIRDMKAMLEEIKRVLKAAGRLLIIDFHKKATPMGPPESRRIAEAEAVKLGSSCGLTVTDEFHLGENLYGIVFKK